MKILGIVMAISLLIALVLSIFTGLTARYDADHNDAAYYYLLFK